MDETNHNTNVALVEEISEPTENNKKDKVRADATDLYNEVMGAALEGVFDVLHVWSKTHRPDGKPRKF